MFNLKA
jgi:hypothetical protein